MSEAEKRELSESADESGDEVREFPPLWRRPPPPSEAPPSPPPSPPPSEPPLDPLPDPPPDPAPDPAPDPSDPAPVPVFPELAMAVCEPSPLPEPPPSEPSPSLPRPPAEAVSDAHEADETKSPRRGERPRLLV